MKSKIFKIPGAEIKKLIPKMGGCMASDKITVDGHRVGYMYRSEPETGCKSGWTFMAGTETQEYADDPDNWALYEVNTIANYDPDIIPYVNSPYRSTFARDSHTGEFVKEPYEEPLD